MTGAGRIASIRVYAHELTMAKGPYVYSGGSFTALTTHLVRIETDRGHVGWGETCPLGPTYQPAHARGASAALAELAPHLIGTEAAPRPVGARMAADLEGHLYAKAAFDIAAHDALARSADLPVHALLGGALRDRIPSYYAIAPMEPEATAEAVAAKWAEGYRSIQLKIGSGDIRRDAASVRAAWGAMGAGGALAADANRALTTADATHLSRLLHDVPVALEQPCSTLEENRSLVGRIAHPIYLDESVVDVGAALHALGRGEADGFGMKLTRVGGLSPMMAIRAVAEARRAPISVDDSWGGDVIAAACVHMGATVAPSIFRGTWLARPYLNAGFDLNGGVTVKDGWIDVPKGPGLGVTPDEALFGAPILEISE